MDTILETIHKHGSLSLSQLESKTELDKDVVEYNVQCLVFKGKLKCVGKVGLTNQKIYGINTEPIIRPKKNWFLSKKSRIPKVSDESDVEPKSVGRPKKSTKQKRTDTELYKKYNKYRSRLKRHGIPFLGPKRSMKEFVEWVEKEHLEQMDNERKRRWS